MMRTVRNILIAGTVAASFIIGISLLLFTIADIPAVLAEPPDSEYDTPAGAQRALVLKRARVSRLQPGDLILVNVQPGGDPATAIRRLERIDLPDESQRLKVNRGGRHATSRHIAEAILDMDFKPTYWMSPDPGAGSDEPVRVQESHIKGKVIRTFSNSKAR